MTRCAPDCSSLSSGANLHACDVGSGQLHYDNFKGHWGEEKYLDTFLQSYAVEKAKIEARRKGHVVTEQALADGSIKLTVQVAGGAA